MGNLRLGFLEIETKCEFLLVVDFYGCEMEHFLQTIAMQGSKITSLEAELASTKLTDFVFLGNISFLSQRKI